jgi:hypothetical protein
MYWVNDTLRSECGEEITVLLMNEKEEQCKWDLVGDQLQASSHFLLPAAPGLHHF